MRVGLKRRPLDSYFGLTLIPNNIKNNFMMNERLRDLLWETSLGVNTCQAPWKGGWVPMQWGQFQESLLIRKSMLGTHSEAVRWDLRPQNETMTFSWVSEPDRQCPASPTALYDRPTTRSRHSVEKHTGTVLVNESLKVIWFSRD